MKIVIALLLALACLLNHPSWAADPPPNRRLREEVMDIASGRGWLAVPLETTIYRPPGDGPFPLLIMNHGKSPGKPAFQGRNRSVVMATEFVRRGYAVILPMRKGFSKSGGQYIDGGCNIAGNGEAQADDVQAVLDYARQQAWVDPSRIIVMGQSHGGLTTMALGARNPAGVKALLNFAGGLRLDAFTCNWKVSLVDAFADYGSRTHIPSLWFYGANDSYFGPDLVERMFAAYTKTGAPAKLVAFGPFKADAHGMSGSRDGIPIWWPPTEALLKEVGMPTERTVVLTGELPRSDFARLEDVEALPYRNEKGGALYAKFLQVPLPRAFAISRSGQSGLAWGGDNPSERALQNCQKNSPEPCALYAIDEDVVWVVPPGKAVGMAGAATTP
ncbi:dienelactone hydrolase family protein [Herbaspirillum seropedicae]|uniref:dienelactone hydrolase family protein n=1 Tax=Herbaspirillum seropedicae TaxID=964 RepID=UPI003D980625